MSTKKTQTEEDMHFYIDNAPPKEVSLVLRILSMEEPLNTREIAEQLQREFDFTMQKDKTYSPRRLFDLGLAEKKEKNTYILTHLGKKIQQIISVDPEFYNDIMHFLHYIGMERIPNYRKLFWSYRRCCEIIWNEKKFLSTTELASRIQVNMKEEFLDAELLEKGVKISFLAIIDSVMAVILKSLVTKFPQLFNIASKFRAIDFNKRTGSRFNSEGASQVYSWVNTLAPPLYGVQLNKEIIKDLKEELISPEKLEKLDVLLGMVQITKKTLEKLKDKIDTNKLKSLINKLFNKDDLKQDLTKLEFDDKQIELILNYVGLRGEYSIEEIYRSLRALNFNDEEINIILSHPKVTNKKNKKIFPRVVNRYELVLLSLHFVYNMRKYRLGDPVILDEMLLNEIAGVFFLDEICCRTLIEQAAKMTKMLSLSDTFSGTSINLLISFDLYKDDIL